MGFARAADVPVILVGDIDCGGVIASIAGTKTVIDPRDAAMIKAFLINKLRGDIQLFDEGYAAIETHTGWKGLGILPWLASVRKLPAEDGVTLEKPKTSLEGAVQLAVPILSLIANFDDFDPLAQEPSIRPPRLPPTTPT